MSESDEVGVGHHDPSRDRTRPFRFKSRSKSPHEHDNADSKKRRRRHHHSSHHRSKKNRTQAPNSDIPLPHDSTDFNPNPDRAFQESLFDALGDDEGAEFWQGVYGQPIHTYPNTYVDEETGELEQMDDDQYAQYVRRRMWEKSREGIEAAREEKRQERLKEKERRRQEHQRQPRDPTPPTEAHNNFSFDFEIEASLRRGQRRKDRKIWQDLWTAYLKKWEDLRSLADYHDRQSDAEELFLRNRIAWPTESGKRKDLSSEEIERFIKRGTESLESDKMQSMSGLLAALKQERIRWHPDKMQHRYGFMQIDDLTMQGVTATFQIFDRMWNELKEK